MLARALPAASGFYVDVGAGHPEIASVTKHFYDLGWHGINIEPRVGCHRAPRTSSGRATSICRSPPARPTARSTCTSSKAIPTSRPSTATTSSILRDRGYGFTVETVPVRTLDSILEEHGVTAIDFLKIDVEGSEADVLAGIDLARWRPTVIVDREHPAVEPRAERRELARDARVAGVPRGLLRRDQSLLRGTRATSPLADALAPASVLDDYETGRHGGDAGGARPACAATSRSSRTSSSGTASVEEEVSGYVSTLESELQPPAAVAPVIELGRSARDRLPSSGPSAGAGSRRDRRHPADR